MNEPLLAASESPVDPELLALPAPPRRDRALTVGLFAATALLAAALTVGLASDVAFAGLSAEPTQVGELVRLRPGDARPNSFVTAHATLDGSRALVYRRTTETDDFELAPVVGNDRWWVEMRVPRNPEGDVFDGSTLRASVLPDVFVGRLVPLHSTVFRYRGLGRSGDGDLGRIRDDAWVLVDGATPASYRWTMALAALLLAFAAYSASTIVRLVRPVRR